MRPALLACLLPVLAWAQPAIAAGKTTAICYVGKHDSVARDVAGRVAQQLGNALVYPVPRPASAAVAREAASSALASGFRTVVLMGDPGDGEDELRLLAGELNGRGGARVVYVKEQEVNPR